MKQALQKVKPYIPEIIFFAIMIIGSIRLIHVAPLYGEYYNKGFEYFKGIIIRCIPFWITLVIAVVQIFLKDKMKIIVNAINVIVAVIFCSNCMKSLNAIIMKVEVTEVIDVSKIMVRYRRTIVEIAVIVAVFSICKIGQVIYSKKKGMA